jgi:hypothetical protein
MNAHNIKNSATRFLPVFTAILIILEIISLNRFAGGGKELQRVNSLISDTNRENILLEERIASYSSMRAISDRAASMGYTKPIPSQYQILTGDQLPVALYAPR